MAIQSVESSDEQNAIQTFLKKHYWASIAAYYGLMVLTIVGVGLTREAIRADLGPVFGALATYMAACMTFLCGYASWEIAKNSFRS